MYLGCTHDFKEIILDSGTKARAVVYNMESYFQSAVDKYCELAQQVEGHPIKLKHVATPFLNEDKKTSPQQRPCDVGPSTKCPWCEHVFPTSPESPWSSKPVMEYGTIATDHGACAHVGAAAKQKSNAATNNQNDDNDSPPGTSDTLEGRGRLQTIVASILGYNSNT